MGNTLANLETAFAGESQANQRYLFFSEKAEKEACAQEIQIEREALWHLRIDETPKPIPLVERYGSNLPLIFEVADRVAIDQEKHLAGVLMDWEAFEPECIEELVRAFKRAKGIYSPAGWCAKYLEKMSAGRIPTKPAEVRV